MQFPQNDPRVDILAIGAHPDDLEHAIGGSLLLWRDRGYSMELVHLTDGSAGTHGSAEIRRAEAEAAARLLDAPMRILDFPDTRVEDNEAARLKIIRLIREVRPRVILAPYYDYPHMHPDHEQAGRIVRHVIRLAKMSGIDTGQEPFHVQRVFYYILPVELRPSFVMDVSSVMDRWRELAWCYRSQLEGLQGYEEALRSRRAMWRAPLGVEWGEAFYSDLPPVGNALDLPRA